MKVDAILRKIEISKKSYDAHFILLSHWGSYVFVKKFFFEILVSEYSEWSKTSRDVIFSWYPDVCVCVRVCVCVYASDF